MRRPLLRSLLAIVGAAVLALSTATPSWGAPTPVALALDGPRSSAWAPFLYAADQGTYRAAGLAVTVIAPGGGGSALASLAAGTADVAVADAAALLARRAGGARVTIIASLPDRHPACIYTTGGSTIKAPRDLAGKTVAVDPLGIDSLAFPMYLQAAGMRAVDLSLVPLDAAGRIAAVVTGSAQGAVGRVDEEPLPAGLEALPWADAGFAAYGPCIAARDDVVRTRPAVLRAFVTATLQAWEACLREPERAAAAVAAASGLPPERTAAWLAAERTLFDTETARTRGMGLLEQARIDATRELVERWLDVPIPYPPAEGWTAAFAPKPPVLLAPLPPAGEGTPTTTAPRP